ncbi:AraC family transcriptional regulator [Pigmentiphaga soli]|uniref:AraC family transcriptional regulator n=1 Tax=Pigmentiphaga soli TaxID=1007095 RepID=A0ABP8HM57_9BURK
MAISPVQGGGPSLAPPAADGAAPDSVLLSSLDVSSTIYHVGQYCGSWSASTAGTSQASFHLVLKGQCWLHIAQQEPQRLGAGDGVFFLRDLAHRLSPDADPSALLAPKSGEMIPLSARPEQEGTGLACGFFSFRNRIGQLVSDALPDHWLIRVDDARFDPARTVVGLILDETTAHAPGSQELLDRLASLLVFYVLRPVVADDPQAGSLLSLARDPAMASVVQAILADPAQPWTLERMARLVHMSAATFHRRFTLLSATTPAQLVQQLRIRLAAHILARGAGIAETAERVGYQSQAAFSRLFMRIMGESPSAWRRMRQG